MGKERKSNNVALVSGDIFLDTAFSLNEIFKPKQRNNNNHQLIEIKKQIGDTEIRIISPYRLSSPELRVYLALLALCCDFNSSYEIENSIKDENYLKIRESLYINKIDNEETLIASECYMSDILKISGLHTGGAQYEQLEEILLHLFLTTIVVNDKSKTTPMRLISFDIFNKEKKAKSKLRFILNSRASNIIFGTDFFGNKLKRRYININDFQSLKESQYFVYIFLSWWIFEGNTQTIYIDTLCAAIYQDYDSLSYSTKRGHRSKIKNDLICINAMNGWSIKLSGKGQALKSTISREKSSDRKKRLSALYR
ncbi:replication protein C, IncQ-type [uncultured Endozoicomonas sp.]|uniref:replication protein C, IncQ-type n=1 Tax=uncultured Endozoicomonas sp. TaxID=432652 RepID=UPI00260D8E89|nr:replication protein C, IncQ-type [uncultured Endozoicomonas sp.]